MMGTALAIWMEIEFQEKLLKLKTSFYGLSFHDPDYNPGEAMVEGQTVAEREKEGTSLGLERYQAFHSASSKVSTKKHVIPVLDGACGFSCMERILEAIGYQLEYVDEDRDNRLYLLTEKE